MLKRDGTDLKAGRTSIITKRNVPRAQRTLAEEKGVIIFGKLKGTVQMKGDLLAPSEEIWGVYAQRRACFKIKGLRVYVLLSWRLKNRVVKACITSTGGRKCDLLSRWPNS